MKKLSTIFILFISFIFTSNAQHIYFKSLEHEQLKSFLNDSSKISLNSADSLLPFKAYFDYVLKFYTKTEYKKIIVKTGKTKKLAKVRSKGLAGFSQAENRVYKITISSSGPDLLDTVAFKRLETDSKIAFIARQMAIVDIYSKSGFFEIMGLFFKQRSKNNKAFQKEVNLNVIEAGLGYQLMNYSSEVTGKLEEEYWRNKKAYRKKGKRYLNTLMSLDAIKTYLNDYPVYLQNNYK